MDYIYHMFLAGWCADAAGARLEFMNTTFSDQVVADAMHFVGDKTTNINDGQFTDDTEMELALLTGLLKGQKDPYFPIERIAHEYIQWYHTHPFDIGVTISSAIADATTADDMASNADEFTSDSESNGSLMRCAPLAVFCLNKPFLDILNIAEVEASLTHSSPVVHLTTGVYCCAISYILTDRIRGNDVDLDRLRTSLGALCAQNDVVRSWYDEGAYLSTLDDYDAVGNEGHVKHAFVMVSYFVHNMERYTYETAIAEVLKRGGDTDTNAKIIGNLLGAYYGNCVPAYMSSPVLAFDPTSLSAHKRFTRPVQYSIHNAIRLAKEASDSAIARSQFQRRV